MLKDMTLGQYFPGNSFLHRLDPRTKILATIVYIVAIFCATNVLAFALLALSAIVLVAVSHISFRTILNGLKPILFVLVFTAAFNIFLTTSTEEAPLWVGQVPLFSFTWTLTVYRVGLLRAAFTALRVVVLIIGTSVFLTYTTSPVTLTDAIEALLRPIPAHTFAMTMTIALRFIPTLVEETDKIMSAQKARGADFANGSLVRRVKALIPVLVPLFVSSFKRAGDLAIAMECRCYRGGEGRTKLHKLHYRPRDLVMGCCMLLLLAGVLVLNWLDLFGIGL